jgi:hypothetical protein
MSCALFIPQVLIDEELDMTGGGMRIAGIVDYRQIGPPFHPAYPNGKLFVLSANT